MPSKSARLLIIVVSDHPHTITLLSHLSVNQDTTAQSEIFSLALPPNHLAEKEDLAERGIKLFRAI
jgi:hypothetical protein